VRTIKTLGIATAMALALVAVAGAGAALANEFKTEVVPEKWSGALLGANHKLALNGDTFACSKVAFSGETKGNGATSVQVTPELNACTNNESTGLGWKMNGCKFRFNAGTYQGIGGLDIIGCEKAMRSETPGGCVTEIPEQSGGGGLQKVEYKNAGSGSTRTITVIAKLTGITFTRSGTCLSGAPKGTFSNGTYTGEWTVKGSTSGGTQAGLEIKSTPLPPAFAAEESPATLSGAISKGLVFNFQSGPGFLDSVNGQLSCENATYSGTVLSPAENVNLIPAFHDCTFVANNVETTIPDKDITAGGCAYELYVKGGFSVVGCESGPITLTTPGCVFKVGSQGGFPGPTFKNEGSGTLRTVKVTNNMNTRGLTYTAEGAGCVAQGTFNGGTPKIGSVMSAKNASGAAQGFWVQ
jgi:hypothetical protein